MATTSGVKTKIQELINKANDTTGENDVELTSAVNRLAEGYSSGGGGSSDTPTGFDAFISGNTDDLVLPTATSIREDGFKNNTKVKAVYAPKVKTIETYAFNASRITSIELPLVEKIAGYAFSSCAYLETVTLGDNIVLFGSREITGDGLRAFASCDRLKNVRLSSNLKILPDYCFAWCYQLLDIVLPAKLEKIGTNCFKSAQSLKKVIIPPLVSYIGGSAFDSSGAETIDFSQHTSIPTLSDTYGCGTTATIIVPDNLYKSWRWATNWSNLEARIVPAVKYVIEGNKAYFYWENKINYGYCFYAYYEDCPTQERLDSIAPNLTLHYGYSKYTLNPNEITDVHIGDSWGGEVFMDDEGTPCYCFIGYTEDLTSADAICEQINKSRIYKGAYREEVIM